MDIPELTNEERQTVLENISLYRQRNSPLLTDAYVTRLYLNGKNEIKKTLEVFGFYEAKVEAAIEKTEEVWSIRYQVNAGEPVIVHNIDLDIRGEGESDKALLKWKQKFPLQPGDRLNHLLYEEAKRNVQNILADYGYFEAALTKRQMQLSLKEHKGDIVIHVDTGPRYLFGDVTYIQEGFDSGYLKRFIPFTKGDHFSAELMSRLHRNLSISGEFKSIELVPLVDAATDHKVPIRVTLIARKPWRFKIGGGYGTDTGVRGRFGVERRHITDTGHRADAELFISKIIRNANANYRIPLKKPGTDYFRITADYKWEDTDTSFSENISASGSAVYGVKSWLRTVSLTWLKERFAVGSETNKSNLLIPGINFTFDPERERKPVVHRPRWHFDINLKGSSTELASDVSYVQGKIYTEFRYRFARKFNVVSRVDVGVSAVDEFSNLPVSQRFFAGGDNSVRGYDYKSLGPVDANGDVVGGTHLFVWSIEGQYLFKPQWDVAVFYDAGNAYDKDQQWEPEQGAGVGVGWLFAFGSARVYAANALSKADNPWRLHILVGANW
ncbi:MAG: autotransporter assembly complex protein TamA [Gammaproteobacteria bacterium]